MTKMRVVSRGALALVSAALVATASLVACNAAKEPQQQKGAVRLSVGALTARSDVTRIAIDVTPANVQADLTYDPVEGTFAGVVLVQSGLQTFTATAYSGQNAVGTGTVTANVLPFETSLVSITIFDTTGAPSVPDHGPVILSLVVSKLVAQVDDSVSMSVVAADPDGDPLTYRWTNSCQNGASGVFTADGFADTKWSNSAAGACSISIEVQSKDLTAKRTFHILVYPAGADASRVDISGNYIRQPVINSVVVYSGYYGYNTTCAVYRDSTNATCQETASPLAQMNVSFSYNSEFSDGGVQQASTSLVDDCGGSASLMYYYPGQASYAWRAPPASALCMITATVSHDGLSDQFPVALLISGCADDSFEPNDSVDRTSWLYLSWGPQTMGGLYATDEDWFSFYKPDGFRRVSVSDPNLSLELYSDFGSLLASGTSAIDYPGNPYTTYRLRIVPNASTECGPAYELQFDSASGFPDAGF
jgi:hypothetical protein